MKDNYDALAFEYATSVNQKSYNAYYERPIMLDLVGDVNNKTILELGCSTGWYTNELTKRGASVLGLDGSVEMIKYARNIHPDLNFVCKDLNEPLDLEGTYDIIFASLVVHYVKDLYNLYANLFELLKPNGKIIISTHNPVVEYQRLTRNYLGIEQVEEEWTFSGKKYKVSYYTRSIQENLMPLIKGGLELREVLELYPKQILREKDPKTYDKLLNKAGFLFIKAVRK